MDSWSYSLQNTVPASEGHPAGESERSALSLAAQLLFCQQPLLIPGLFFHCVTVYYVVLVATPPHPSAHSPALHPLLCAVVGRGPWLGHTPHQPLNFVWTASLTYLKPVFTPFLLEAASPENWATSYYELTQDIM